MPRYKKVSKRPEVIRAIEEFHLEREALKAKFKEDVKAAWRKVEALQRTYVTVPEGVSPDGVSA